MAEEFTGDRPNHFLNRTGPKGDVNNGSRGKFNEAQTVERAKLHARSITTKYPTMPQMVQIYKEKFNIDISLESEKQWRKSNWDLIMKTKQEMIDKGEIEVTTIGSKALAENLQVLVIKSSVTLEQMRKKLQKCLDGLDHGSKPIVANGRTIIVNDNLETFKAVSDAMAKLSGALVKQIDTLAGLSGDARAREREKDDEDFAEEAAKVNKEFDPSDIEISESDRALLE